MNDRESDDRHLSDGEFGYRVRQALNEGLDHVDYRTTLKLQQAREAALARQRGAQPARAWALQTAGGTATAERAQGWWPRLGLAAPVLALVVGFVGIYQYQEERRISELADMDFAVLMDDVPLDAYADKGFGALLRSDSNEL